MVLTDSNNGDYDIVMACFDGLYIRINMDVHVGQLFGMHVGGAVGFLMSVGGASSC